MPRDSRFGDEREEGIAGVRVDLPASRRPAAGGAPPGRDVRPTSDRAREALFSMLGDVDGLEVLDLFAGTGALAIEAVSRGARAPRSSTRGRKRLEPMSTRSISVTRVDVVAADALELPPPSGARVRPDPLRSAL